MNGKKEAVQLDVEADDVGLGDISHDVRDTGCTANDICVSSSSAFIRPFDIVLSVISIILTFPVMLLVGIAVKLTSKGPVLFIQERLGQHKRPFRMIKFRTMVVDAELNGPIWAKKNDERITRVGRFLRQTRLDELPQFFNILMGDISFVGPRPIRRYYAEKLSFLEKDYDKRFLVKPGLTGYAQIYAPYGSTFEEQLQKLPYELRYLNGLSIKEYFKVLFLTAKVVLKGNGV